MKCIEPLIQYFLRVASCLFVGLDLQACPVPPPVGDGTFGAATNFAVGDHPISVAIGDVNGDGALDAVTANFSSDNISVLLGDGMGSLGAASDFAAGDDPRSVAVGDVNGDGALDAVTRTLTRTTSRFTGRRYRRLWRRVGLRHRRRSLRGGARGRKRRRRAGRSYRALRDQSETICASCPAWLLDSEPYSVFVDTTTTLRTGDVDLIPPTPP